MISILHPSRGRPHKSLATMRKWWARAGTRDIETIISVDEDDIELNNYEEYYGANLFVGKHRSAIDAINNAAKVATGDIFIVVSDDTDCPHNWAVKLLAYTKGLKDFVMKTNDGLQRHMITMPIFDRAYYNRFGYVYHPDYKHLCADMEFSDVAYKLKRVVRKMAFKFPHNQYSIIGQPPDEIYLRNNSTHKQGKEVYLRRKKINFGL